MAFPTATNIKQSFQLYHILQFFCQSFWVFFSTWLQHSFLHLKKHSVPNYHYQACSQIMSGLLCAQQKRLLQQQAQMRDVHCSSIDTGLCQDLGIRARFYVPREDPLCFSLSDRNCFQECVILPYIIIFFKKSPNVNENTHTDLVNWHFTVSKWASIPPAAYL